MRYLFRVLLMVTTLSVGGLLAGCCIDDGSQCSPVDDEACCSERCDRPTIMDNYRCMPSSLTSTGQAMRAAEGGRFCLSRFLRRL